MNKKRDKEKIVQEIILSAKIYKKKLVGKRFIYLFDNRYIEVLYKKNNFKHLTGVDTYLSANRFYQLAVDGKLQKSQIYFSQRHPFSLCKKKVKHISEIANLAVNESFMLEEIITNTEIYKFGTTELTFSLCMNKERDENGKEIGDCFIVKSIRDEDCFKKSKNVYEVTHIFSKDNNKKGKYTNIVFMDRNHSMQELRDEIKNLIEENLLEEGAVN